jgi:hypothetical protein
MSVPAGKIRSCTRDKQLKQCLTYQKLTLSTRRTLGSAAYRSLPSDIGALVAAASRPGLSWPGRARARGAMPDAWMSRRTHTCWACPSACWACTSACWACTSATGTSRADSGTRTCSLSSAPIDWPGAHGGRPPALYAVMPTLRVSQVHQIGCTMIKSYSNHWPCLFPQHGPGPEAHAQNRAGRMADHHHRQYPGEFARGLFHSDGWRGVNRVRRRLADGDHRYEYSRYLFGNESGTFCSCAGRRWTGSGGVALLPAEFHIGGARRRRGARRLARLDEFVGPKY